MNYAGFWRRVLASIIDSIIFIPVSFVISVTQSYGDAYIQGFITNLILGWLYYSLCESQSWQATLGKKMVSIKVVDLHGDRITFARASARYAAKFLSSVIFGIGYLMAGFTSRKQALHDLVAETLVIKNQKDSATPDSSQQGTYSQQTVVLAKSSDKTIPNTNVSNKIVMAGFDSTGHVIRLNFDINDEKLVASGLIIGRDASRSDLHISDQSISRVHARIYKKNGDLWIEDMGSTNGMIVNGRKVQPKSSAFLSVSGTISIGGIDLTLGRM